MKNLKSLFFILLGNFIYALAVRLFLMSSNLATGGVTGISIALNSVTGTRVSVIAFILNMIMWVLGLFLLGKKFAFSTLISTIAFPVFLNILESVLGNYRMTSDILLCTIMGGLLMGGGLGLVLREGSSTGGMDVVPLSMNKYFRLSVSATMYALDILIVLAQVLVFPIENILYGSIQILVYSIVMEKVLLTGKYREEMLIISPEHEKIRQFILTEMDRGVTMLNGSGGYTGDSIEVVMSVVSKRQVPKLEKMVRTIDPNAMIIMSPVTEVAGRGFTLAKKYQ